MFISRHDLAVIQRELKALKDGMGYFYKTPFSMFSQLTSISLCKTINDIEEKISKIEEYLGIEMSCAPAKKEYRKVKRGNKTR